MVEMYEDEIGAELVDESMDTEEKTAADILKSYVGMPNIADLGEELEETADMKLDDIGRLCLEEYRYDDESRSDWKESNEEGLKLACLIKDGRKWAGESIADVKYPTIAAAAIQYASRAYPAIVKDEEVVKYKVTGADPDGKKAARGGRVASFINYQLLENIENWDTDMDKMLFLQPIVGVYYKKTYFNPEDRKIESELIGPEDLVMYYQSTFDQVARKTQIIYMTHNEYIEQVRDGLFTDLDLEPPDTESEAGLHMFLEQHRLLDLDGDGYEEPYIVVVHEKSGKVARIAARFDEAGISVNDAGEVRRVKAIEYFTEYPFMPSFDGGIYHMGFGILLGPLNESINTLFNQILDAGTRANFQSGFIGRGVRLLRGGELGSVKFRRGEWKQVAAAGDDLRKSIFPLPTPSPDAVLFQLLGFLVQASKELSSQSDLLAGQQQQHNVPATSTMALIEQGLQVFNGIYKRMYRSLRIEYKRVHWLCARNTTKEEYANVVDGQDADISDLILKDCDIRPVSTAAAVTETQKYIKAQALMQLKGGGLDDDQINRFYLEALGIPDVDRFFPKEQPPPPPQFIIAMRELDLREREIMLKEREFVSKDAKTATEIRELRERMAKLRADAQKSLAQAEAAVPGFQGDLYDKQLGDIVDQLWALEQKEKAFADAMQMRRARPMGPPPQGGASQQGPAPQGPKPMVPLQQ